MVRSYKISGMVFLVILVSISILRPDGQTATELYAGANNYICAVFFEGEGCEHCAHVDSLVADELFEKYDNLVFIKYELNATAENADVIGDYNSAYFNGFSIPQIIFNDNYMDGGEELIFANIRSTLEDLKDGNKCPLPGEPKSFRELNFTALDGRPQIWLHDRLLIKQGDNNPPETTLKVLIFADNIESALKGLAYQAATPETYDFWGLKLKFDRAITVGDWLFQWQTGQGQEQENK